MLWCGIIILIVGSFMPSINSENVNITLIRTMKLYTLQEVSITCSVSCLTTGQTEDGVP